MTASFYARKEAVLLELFFGSIYKGNSETLEQIVSTYDSEVNHTKNS